jgi:uncharacterized protein
MSTATDLPNRQPAATEEELGLVDCDIHCRLSGDYAELHPYLSTRWRELMSALGSRRYGGLSYPRFWKDPVDYAPPSGGPPGSDVGFMGTDLLDRYNIAYGILIPRTPATFGSTNLDLSDAMARAANEFQLAEWLEPEPRLRGSIVVATEDGERAAAEIRRLGGDRRFVQVGFSGRPHEPMGRRRYWPIYEACAENGLAIMSHAFGSAGHPITGTGWPSYYIEDHVTPSLAMQANITSLIMEGVFERFPTLKVISVENGFGWAAQLAWRMDNAWKLLKAEVPHLKRLPSEYMAEHVYFATQPIEEPAKRQFFAHIFTQYPAFAQTLCFSSDYPHWDGDSPKRALSILRDPATRDNILRYNARRLYGLT